MDAWTAHSRCAKMAPRSDPPHLNLIITKSEWHQNQPLGLIFCLFLRSSDLNFLPLANSARDISKIALKKTLDLFLTRRREILTRRREIFTRSNLFFLARLFVSQRKNLEDTFARCEKYWGKLDIISLAYSYLCKNKLQVSALAKRAKAFSYKKTVWKNISYPLENIAQ